MSFLANFFYLNATILHFASFPVSTLSRVQLGAFSRLSRLRFSKIDKPSQTSRKFGWAWHPRRESNSQLTLRRGLLYPFNYGGLCNCGAAHGRLVYSTQFHRYCQCGTRTFLESGGFFSPSAVAIPFFSGYNEWLSVDLG